MLKALLYATLVATLCALAAFILALIPGVQLMVMFIAMLPLWMLSDAGVGGLGEPKEGFFVPTEHGMAVALFAFWLLCFSLVFIGMLIAAISSGRRRSHEPWWKRSERRW